MVVVIGNFSCSFDVGVVWPVYVPYYTEVWILLEWGIMESLALPMKIHLRNAGKQDVNSFQSSGKSLRIWRMGEWLTWILEWCCQAPEFLQTSVLAVVLLLVDCPSERVLLSLMELGLGFIHVAQSYCIITQNFHFLGLFLSSETVFCVS